MLVGTFTSRPGLAPGLVPGADGRKLTEGTEGTHLCSDERSRSPDRWPRRPEPDEDDRAREPEHEARGPLEKCCESIESQALRSGWALRVCLGPGRRARTFALRGRNTAGTAIVLLDEEPTRALIHRGLAGTGVNEQEWHELVNQASNPGAKSRIPPRTVWNRPALTVAGTAPGILKQWESAWVAKR